MNIWGFLSASIVLTLMPGPDILFVITQSINRGMKAGIIFALGLCTGLIAHTAAISLGLSILLYNSPLAFNILKVLGACYLLYLSYKVIKNRNKVLNTNVEVSDIASRKLYGKGILMNILNPKVLLFFIAFFPQFIDPKSINPARELIILGLLFMLQAIIVFSFIAIVSDKLSRNLMENVAFRKAMTFFEAAIYFVIAVSLLFVSLN